MRKESRPNCQGILYGKERPMSREKIFFTGCLLHQERKWVSWRYQGGGQRRIKPQSIQQLGMAHPQSFTHPGCRLANHFQVSEKPNPEQFVPVKGFPTTGEVTRNRFDGFKHVFEPIQAASHNGTASASMRAWNRSRTPPSLTTSTRTPKSSSKSIASPPWSKRLRPGSNATRKSTSLDGVASPRATDPKIQTRCAPRALASRRISPRFSRSASRFRVYLLPGIARRISRMHSSPPTCHMRLCMTRMRLSEGAPYGS